ncbi:hypothetical protein V6N11_051559 [Hibiscus sabdariffa]|uniref:DUF4283 domain-containing protein n=1 Tax=Hibiscus sabdariffa TaxID=183260 RepID=A0ABR2U7M0_9ROSI
MEHDILTLLDNLPLTEAGYVAFSLEEPTKLKTRPDKDNRYLDDWETSFSNNYACNLQMFWIRIYHLPLGYVVSACLTILHDLTGPFQYSPRLRVPTNQITPTAPTLAKGSLKSCRTQPLLENNHTPEPSSSTSIASHEPTVTLLLETVVRHIANNRVAKRPCLGKMGTPNGDS